MNPAIYVILSLGQIVVPYLLVVAIVQRLAKRKRAYAHNGY